MLVASVAVLVVVCWLEVVGWRLLVGGCCLLFVVCCSLFVGCWLCVVGCWLYLQWTFVALLLVVLLGYSVIIGGGGFGRERDTVLSLVLLVDASAT